MGPGWAQHRGLLWDLPATWGQPVLGRLELWGEGGVVAGAQQRPCGRC